MIAIIRIIFGFLRVKFYGDNKEKILSLCAQNGISLWSTKLSGDGIECDIAVGDFKYLRKLIRGKGIRVHILKKSGVPFLLSRYNRRLGIAIGVVLFFSVLLFMSQYIWIIDIEGNKKVTENEIRNACREIGIVTGIPKNSIYPKGEREKLMLKLDGVAWASLNIEGSRLVVNISEAKEETEKSSYSNLIAETDGVIKKIDVVSGTVVVKVGDGVKKGDLLVSGIVETAYGTSFVNAKGTIIAESQRYIELKEDYIQKHIIPTGKIKTKRVLELFGFKIPLFLGGETSDFLQNKTVKTLKLFGNDLPVKIHKNTCSFQKVKRQKYSYEKLTERLENELLGLSEKDKFSVLEKEFLTNSEGVTLKALTGSEENIAVKEKILINAGK